MRPGTWQIVILVLVILLLFGARRLPDLARSVGQSLKIFKSEVKDLQQDESPRAVEARRDETSTHPATGQDSGAPATSAATEHRPADGDRGPTT